MTYKVFGIDLGTTNSCISYVDGDKHEVIQIDGEKTVPSVVGFKDGKFIVGKSAKNYRMIAPQNTVASIKRKMDNPAYRTTLGSESFSPIDISAKILQYLASEGEKVVGEKIKKVVITVPAWFHESQRQGTLAAGKLAELDVIQIINEPTAAALAFEQHEIAADQEEKWLVYDLGGGTFDVSVLNITRSTHEVLATSGNSFLGGDDFDLKLSQFFVAKLRDLYNIDVANEPTIMARLHLLAEQTKISLSNESKVKINQPIVFNEQNYLLDFEMERHQFEEMIADLIDSTFEKTINTLHEAHLSKEKITRLLLVGGSTRIPMISEGLIKKLGIIPDAWIDPDLSVSLGASLQAAIATGNSFKRSMVDVCPHSLGIAALGEEDGDPMSNMLDDMFGGKRYIPKTFVPLIRKNSKLPASFVRSFNKMHEEQDIAEIIVMQGESTLTTNNTMIGKFIAKLKNLNSRQIDIRFTYDINGMVRVNVEEMGEKPIEHSLDLTKPYVDNDHYEFAEIDDDDDVLDVESNDSNVSNYLVEQVKKKLQPTHPDFAKISATLEQYQILLKSGEDDLIDELEDQLYTWLDV